MNGSIVEAEKPDTKRIRLGNGVGEWVARVGLPGAFALILLWQTNAKLDKLAEAVTKLVTVVESKR